MNVAIVVVTHNRLEYTRKCLGRLLADPTEEFELYVYDNASTDGTRQYLTDAVKDRRVREVHLSDENLGPTRAMNHYWRKIEAEFVGRVDNDCLVTPGWTRTLAVALRDVDRLGAVACWHFPVDDFDEKAARSAGKIQCFGQHQLVRHPWLPGSGFLMKRSTFLKYGEWPEGRDASTSGYFLRMALAGEINGWYYPFVPQEHMDDPTSKHTLLTDDASVESMRRTTYVLRTHNIGDLKGRWRLRRKIVATLSGGPWQAEYYTSWRWKLKKAFERLR